LKPGEILERQKEFLAGDEQPEAMPGDIRDLNA